MELEPLIQPLRADATQYVHAIEDSVKALQKFNSEVGNVSGLEKNLKALDEQYGKLRKLEGQLRRHADTQEYIQKNQRGRFRSFFFQVPQHLDPAMVERAEQQRQERRDREEAHAARVGPMRFTRFDAMSRQRAKQRIEDGRDRADRAARARRGSEIIGRIRGHMEKDRLRGDTDFKKWAAEKVATAQRRKARRPELEARAAARMRRLRFPRLSAAGRRVGIEARRFRRHPFRRGMAGTAAAGRFGLGAAEAGLGAGADALSSIFNINSIPGMIATFTGVTLALYGISKAVNAVSSSFSAMVTNGMEMERTRVTFEVLLGSVERGRKLFAEIQELGIISPYTTKNLQNTAQTLLGMGASSSNIIPILSRIGDVASGDADRFRHLSYAFGQVMAEGKMSGIRMRQFATGGVGVGDFSKTMGVTPGMFRALLRSNMVGENVMIETFNRLTSAGGRFFEMSNRGLTTVYGQWERLNDTVEQTSGKMGEAFMQHAGVAQGLGGIADWLQELQPRLVTFAGSVGDIFKTAGTELRPILEAFGIAAEKRGQVLSPLFGAMSPDQGGMSRFYSILVDVFEMIGKITSQMVRFFTVIAENAPYVLTKLFGGLKELFAPGMTNILGNKGLSELFGHFEADIGVHQPPSLQNQGPLTILGRAAPVEFASFMKDWREAITGRQAAANFVGPMQMTEEDKRRAVERTKAAGRIALNAEYFPEGQRIVQEVLGKTGFTSPTGVGSSLGTGVTGLEGFANRQKAIRQQMLGGQGFFDERGEIGGRGALAGLGGLLGGLGGKGISGVGQLIGTGLQAAAPFLPMGPLGFGGGNMLKVANYDSYMKLRSDLGSLTDPAGRLVGAATYGSSEAVDAINKAMLNSTSVQEEVLRTLDIANELHRSTSEYMNSVDATLKEINEGKLVVKEVNP